MIAGLPMTDIAEAKQRDLTIDDVLAIERVDEVAPSPDGSVTAIVVQRSATDGESYGRTHYEIDPSRNGVWISGEGQSEARRIAPLVAKGAGFWCAQWSPDGAKLAMLSTQADGSEPSQGDNVRIYVWDKASGALSRLANEAVVTQSRYGSWFNRLDVRHAGQDMGKAKTCRVGEENAPFAWLDGDRLMALTLADGEVSTLLDEYSRPVRHAELTRERLLDGQVPTATAVGSGDARTTWQQPAGQPTLRVYSVSKRTSIALGQIPDYPFRGDLAVSVSPDNRFVAILATEAALAPGATPGSVRMVDSWQVQKRLGIAELNRESSVRWVELPQEAKLPLELFEWSPNGRSVAFRARADAASPEAHLFRLDLESERIRSVGNEPVGATFLSSLYPIATPVRWLDSERLLVTRKSSSEADAREDWFVTGAEQASVNITANLTTPATQFVQGPKGNLYGIGDGNLLTLSSTTGQIETRTPLSMPGETAVVGIQESIIILRGQAEDGRIVVAAVDVSSTPAVVSKFELPEGAELSAISGSPPRASYVNQMLDRTEVGEFDILTGKSRTLKSISGYPKNVRWGERVLLDYVGTKGEPLKAVALMPPGYSSDVKYPVLTWVYPGYRVSGADTHVLDPYLPGIYNLQLYAARGYIVLVPSLSRGAPKTDENPFAQITAETHAALDALIAKGNADPKRVAIMGQSNGGFGVYAILTQSDRFKAGIAIDGVTDFVGFFSQFDPTSRGYDGIEHEKSVNWAIAQRLDFTDTPYRDYSQYTSKSPLFYASRINTPLLLAHGEYDIRASAIQADQLFYMLYSQNKTARLLRYWGENHSISLSPANVRNLLDETFTWLRKYVK
ncbi:hypothetical protein ATE67_19425 [Sphingopyxis sp. H050]|nr:hypothetical protein ATE76_20360 [Sphingopyxis sp. H093]KTE12087.1 hypothetical protein ATE71_10955 [Sphingopyxis sp. H115]KTE18138.1 hypothetical protein ATE67_19425 [Sphingopyxis sp. H050]KTE63799.1 hypothetical protein ATE74_18665 [Sphingopyxis sp. H085]